MRRPCTILLTATVRPAAFDVGTHVRRDVATRIADYIAGLRFWDCIDDNRVQAIVFCDNSGEDLTPLREVARDLRRPTEILTFKDAPAPPKMHYGYGELGIIDYALRHSRRLASGDFFLKSTGRLTFPQISSLLDALPDNISGAVDHRRSYRHEGGPRTRARTQLMVFSPALYAETLFERRDEMRGLCTHIEEFIAYKFETTRFNPPFFRRFPVECPASGVGGNGQNFDTWKGICKSFARKIARRFFPHLWL
jgi:hypothetical protein